MRYWRMMMKDGKGGDNIFPFCKQRGIAALDCYSKYNRHERVVEDCRNLSDEQYRYLWNERYPRNASGSSSLRTLWKEIKCGDIIYAKAGTRVVGKGIIVGEYAFDPNILKDTPGHKWGHYVSVSWESDFVEFEFKYYAPAFIIREVVGDELQRLLEKERQTAF